MVIPSRIKAALIQHHHTQDADPDSTVSRYVSMMMDSIHISDDIARQHFSLYSPSANLAEHNQLHQVTLTVGSPVRNDLLVLQAYTLRGTRRRPTYRTDLDYGYVP